jgi:hypothetical protein
VRLSRRQLEILRATRGTTLKRIDDGDYVNLSIGRTVRRGVLGMLIRAGFIEPCDTALSEAERCQGFKAYTLTAKGREVLS